MWQAGRDRVVVPDAGQEDPPPPPPLPGRHEAVFARSPQARLAQCSPLHPAAALALQTEAPQAGAWQAGRLDGAQSGCASCLRSLLCALPQVLVRLTPSSGHTAKSCCSTHTCTPWRKAPQRCGQVVLSEGHPVHPCKLCVEESAVGLAVVRVTPVYRFSAAVALRLQSSCSAYTHTSADKRRTEPCKAQSRGLAQAAAAARAP